MSLVLADTSVWIAHFRKPNPALQTMLLADQVLCHPMVLIEIACGTPPAAR
jgi:predicted nucleic acid-binding protein